MRIVKTTKFVKLSSVASEIRLAAKLAGAPDYLVEIGIGAFANNQCDINLHRDATISRGYQWGLSVKDNTNYFREARLSIVRKEGEIKMWTEVNLTVVEDGDERIGTSTEDIIPDESETKKPEAEAEA